MHDHFPSSEIGPFGRRQRHARGARIPVTVVARISGAGKTTIRAGDVLCTTSDATALIGNCRCCTIRSDLVAALRPRAAARTVAHITIETGDPLPALRTFMTDRALGADFHVDAPLPAPEDASRFVLAADAPLAWDAFSRFMETLVGLRGTDMLQADGWLNVAGCRGPVAVRFMQHLALPPVELTAWPDQERRSRLAFVTRRIPESEVRRLFDAVLALPSA